MKADQLQGYLARSAKDGRLDPFWLLTGSDAFLAVEAGDAIRAEARRQGYTDRQVLDMNASADWSRLTMAAADIGMPLIDVDDMAVIGHIGLSPVRCQSIVGKIRCLYRPRRQDRAILSVSASS